METIADLLADARDREAVAVTGPDRGTPMTAQEAVTSAWQMGNLFRHYGVRPGERVAVVAGPTNPTGGDEPGHLGSSPVPVLAVLGALAAGGIVDLDPPGAVDATVLVAPAAWLDRYRPGPGTTAMGYGQEPAATDAAHLEREAWSENPTAPPADLDPTTDALGDDRLYTQGDLLALARGVIAEHGLDDVERVSLSAPLVDVGTLLAGVVAPLAVGAPLVLDGDDAPVVVASDQADAGRLIDPAAVAAGDT
jgi:hypothetical protein